MKQNHKVLVISIALSVSITLCQYIYCEQVEKDMFASVVVLPAFKLSLDKANISFGFVKPGETVELYPQTNYNEVKCISNKGNSWYLRLSIVGTIVGPPDANVGIENFKWMVPSAMGDGIVEKGWHSFTEMPAQAYASGPRDSTGEEVRLQFKYKLDLPKNAIGGNYGVNVLYTMTETP